jgi:hypothetical protein
MSKNLPGGRRTGRNARTCPVSRCKHPVLLHDVDEIDWPRIERCTVQDCDCSGQAREVAA